MVGVYCLQGNGIDRADTAGCNGKGWREDQCCALNTIDRPAVCAGFKHKASGTAGGNQVNAVYGCFQNTGQGWWNESEIGATLRTPCGGDSTKANLVTAVDCRNGTENPDINGTLQAKEQGQNVNSNNVCRQGSVVRRLTPLECERLQGFPSKKMVDVSQMTKDEYIAWNLAEGNIIANQERGKVYGTRGPGGCPYKEPKELKGSDVNGYKVVSIRNGATKLQCRVHRIIWISAHGIIPDGYVIDHINNDKTDNRLENLQLLTPEQNSQKAQADGLYKSGLDNKATKLDPDLKDEIAFLYEYSDLTMRNLAELYGVSKSRIAQIVHEVGWTDIGEWTDTKGKKHKAADSQRFKALGNSIALPFWFYLLRRISAQYERPATLGSLFDGIGGFPLCWERCNGSGTAIWASEIEEFPIAVTKKHFPEEKEDT